jgi:hypothetical protein
MNKCDLVIVQTTSSTHIMNETLSGSVYFFKSFSSKFSLDFWIVFETRPKFILASKHEHEKLSLGHEGPDTKA